MNMKWIFLMLLVFSAAIGGGVYFLSKSGSGSGVELDWRLLGQLDYISNKASTELQKIDGQRVKIPGFIVPLEDNNRQVTEFLLVPSPQACIHVPPPPPNPATTEGPTTTIEQAIETTHQLRDKFQDGLNQLRDLSMKLKFIHREQRTSSREFNSVRSTLRSIQGLKL